MWLIDPYNWTVPGVGSATVRSRACSCARRAWRGQSLSLAFLCLPRVPCTSLVTPGPDTPSAVSALCVLIFTGLVWDTSLSLNQSPTPVIFQAQLGTQAWSQSYAHTGVGVPGDLQRKISVLLKGPGGDSQLTIKCLLHQCRFMSFKFSPVANEREKGNYQYMPSLRSFFAMLEIRRARPHPRLWRSLWSLWFSCAYPKYWS